mgnify:CR=1 FL=1
MDGASGINIPGDRKISLNRTIAINAQVSCEIDVLARNRCARVVERHRCSANIEIERRRRNVNRSAALNGDLIRPFNLNFFGALGDCFRRRNRNVLAIQLEIGAANHALQFVAVSVVAEF